MFMHNRDADAVACEPGVSRKILAYNDALMMCEIRFEKGARGYVHAHPHTQITYVAKGSFRFTVGGDTRTVVQGDSILIPPDAPHGVEALEDSMLVDVFHPMREDFISSK